MSTSMTRRGAGAVALALLLALPALAGAQQHDVAITGGTVVTVTESGHTASPKDLEALVECASGWGEALTLLKVYLEHGITYGEVPA